MSLLSIGNSVHVIASAQGDAGICSSQTVSIISSGSSGLHYVGFIGSGLLKSTVSPETAIVFQVDGNIVL